MKKNLETILNVVIGTAGHIDHGKSTLVERLTGVHPDRLPEEKARGLTIDLGFAPLLLRTGHRVGIIDVPGHERLVKNMVAGATGIDLVLLVVAADDGVMPQTREHVAIMELLGLEEGIVVLTKIDMVDQDLRELVKEDLQDALRGTFLETAPVAEVSSITGEGIPELLELIHQKVAHLKPRETTGIFRMPIQRVFSAKGFGTVVTGVPVSGHTQLGDTLEIVPLERKGRVRGIHAYGEATDLARAGHSTAINLTDVDYREVHRGMVLTESGYFRGSTMFEARFRYLATSKKPLASRTAIRLHVGTAEGLGRVHLLEDRQLEPGEETWVQLRLEGPIVAAPGDRFVLRLYSPLETIGGGEILDRSRWRLKAGKAYVLESLKEKEAALDSQLKLLQSALDSAGFEAVHEKDLALRAGLPLEEARTLIQELVSTGTARPATRPGHVLSTSRLEEARRSVEEDARRFFAKNPHRLFHDKPLLRQAVKAGDLFFQELLATLTTDGLLVEQPGGRLKFRDFGPRLSPEDVRAREAILAALEAGGFTPPAPEEVAKSAGLPLKTVTGLLVLLEQEGEALNLAVDVHFHRKTLEEARRLIREHLLVHKTMTAADARNILGSTRKYMIPLLEHLDKEGFTVRKGDLRELRPE